METVGCPYCGVQVQVGSAFCPSCGTAVPTNWTSPPGEQPRYYPRQPAGTVKNYLAESIVVTILCCWAFGIPAIINAAKVDGLMNRGDFAGAVEASNAAKKWCWVSAGVGIGITVLYLIFVVALGMAGGFGKL